MKKYITLLISLFLMGRTYADELGERVLKQAKHKIESAGDVKIVFKTAAIQGKTETELKNMSGEMLIQGIKYHIQTPELLIWYNGKDQWSLVPEHEEVNLTTPTQNEVLAMHPYSFLSMYESGYQITTKKSQYKNIPTYEVHLVADKTNKNGIEELYVDVQQSNYQMLSLRVKQGSQWHRIYLQTIKAGLKLSAKDFTYPQEKYSHVEIIDLR